MAQGKVFTYSINSINTVDVHCNSSRTNGNSSRNDTCASGRRVDDYNV